MLDAIAKATSVPVTYNITGGLPAVTSAMKLPDTLEVRNNVYGRFLDEFGRGNRDDQARSNDSSIAQALSLMNDGTVVVNRVHKATANSTVAKTLASTTDPNVIADQLYLYTLSRYPTAAEKTQAVAYLKSGTLAKQDRRSAMGAAQLRRVSVRVEQNLTELRSAHLQVFGSSFGVSALLQDTRRPVCRPPWDNGTACRGRAGRNDIQVGESTPCLGDRRTRGGLVGVIDERPPSFISDNACAIELWFDAPDVPRPNSSRKPTMTGVADIKMYQVHSEHNAGSPLML